MNTCNSEGDYEYYKFSDSDDCIDDSYMSCAFIPTTDIQPQILEECKVPIDSGSEAEESEEQYDPYEV